MREQRGQRLGGNPGERQRRAVLKGQARRAEAAGRAALAGWLGDTRVHALVAWLRPQLQPLLAAFPVADEDITSATGVLTGMTGRT